MIDIDEAKKRYEELIEMLPSYVGFRMSEKYLNILRITLKTYSTIIRIQCEEDDDMTKFNDFFYMVEDLGILIGEDLTDYI